MARIRKATPGRSALAVPMRQSSRLGLIRVACVGLALIVTGGCTTLTINEYKRGQVELSAGDAVVVLGRRHASDYETEPELVSCVGRILSSGDSGIRVIPEQEFVDALYPWFEPRTAPLKTKQLARLLEQPRIPEKIAEYRVSHIIWIDGSTQTTSKTGSLSCGLTPGGGGCLGFATWDKESEYEASVWDYRNLDEIGKISAGGTGTSYLPAVIVPIPIIARVRNETCEGIGMQLRKFFKPENS